MDFCSENGAKESLASWDLWDYVDFVKSVKTRKLCKKIGLNEKNSEGIPLIIGLFSKTCGHGRVLDSGDIAYIFRNSDADITAKTSDGEGLLHFANTAEQVKVLLDLNAPLYIR